MPPLRIELSRPRKTSGRSAVSMPSFLLRKRESVTKTCSPAGQASSDEYHSHKTLGTFYRGRIPPPGQDPGRGLRGHHGLRGTNDAVPFADSILRTSECFTERTEHEPSQKEASAAHCCRCGYRAAATSQTAWQGAFRCCHGGVRHRRCWPVSKSWHKHALPWIGRRAVVLPSTKMAKLSEVETAICCAGIRL